MVNKMRKAAKWSPSPLAALAKGMFLKEGLRLLPVLSAPEGTAFRDHSKCGAYAPK